jgi:serine/threonine-protein kinase
MGEVFRAQHQHRQRVAIKVMLPAMAADEGRRHVPQEARTSPAARGARLHRLAGADRRALHCTEFIEGVELADMLGKVERTPEELAGLLKRLASGLSAAHRLGAVHRDMSPDNVLLPGGDVHQAKIIDFGIAKDLDASSATIVGDGFAGKLNYVAPEQLGDYGREVGPWSDVYSLALVILAVAQGRMST